MQFLRGKVAPIGKKNALQREYDCVCPILRVWNVQKCGKCTQNLIFMLLQSVLYTSTNSTDWYLVLNINAPQIRQIFGIKQCEVMTKIHVALIFAGPNNHLKKIIQLVSSTLIDHMDRRRIPSKPKCNQKKIGYSLGRFEPTLCHNFAQQNLWYDSDNALPILCERLEYHAIHGWII